MSNPQGFNPRRQNGWDAWGQDVGRGFGVLALIIIAIAASPVLIPIGICWLAYKYMQHKDSTALPPSMQPNNTEPYGKPEPDGLYVIYNPDHTIYARCVPQSQVGRYLKLAHKQSRSSR